MNTGKRKSRYGYLWVTLALFLISIVGHWISGWYEFADDQKSHHQPRETKTYVIKMLRGTFENWRSEFLQLIWQVGGLSFLWYVGSPSSKEGDDRKEEKLDAILRRLDPKDADALIKQLDVKYPRK